MPVKHKKLIIALSVVGGVLIAAVVAFFIYTGIYYRATDYARAVAETDTDTYEVRTVDDNIVFMPKNEIKAGLIFYPGGKVEHTAYAPLMAEFASRGTLTILLKVPFRLAVFDKNAANGLKDGYPDVPRWYVGGHSLGGAMASSYMTEHIGQYEGLLLLGAYCSDDFSGTGMNVITVYGSEDRVMNAQKYADNKKYLPADYKELVIDGGCHAYFGDYGAQDGDGTPTISAREQWEITAEFFISSLR